MNTTENNLKTLVRERYEKIALQDKDFNASSCCGATPNSNKIYNIMMDDYTQVAGYEADADLGLGCGLPTAFAQINKGDVVIDLGSGAGNDCFVARHETGPEGKVIGIDFSENMIKRARANTEKLGYHNVEFRMGDIDNMPVNDAVADVVVSNCVLNLVPDKPRVIREIFRVLKPGGHFSISDVVLEGELPETLKHDAEMYAGCVAGASQKAAYLKSIDDAGFLDVTVQKSKPIVIPHDILEKYLDTEGVQNFESGHTGIFSITVYGQKPGAAKPKPKINLKDLQAGCCTPEGGCC